MKNSEIISKIQNEKHIVIFGFGVTGNYLWDLIKTNNLDVEMIFCDNAKDKQTPSGEKVVLSVENAVEKYPDAFYVYTRKANKEIFESQLLSLGVRAERIFCAETDETRDYLQQQTLDKKKLIWNEKASRNKIQFEVNLAEHCNLNCKCCSQFSCIATPEIYEIEQLEKDLTRMSEIFNGICKHIYLIGGEPLLHPDIVKCIQIARKCFPIGEISIFTNGTLLLNQKQSFWLACKENNVSLIMTKYPIKLDYEKIELKAKLEGIPLSYFNNAAVEKHMVSMNLDTKGEQNPQISYNRCPEANNCIKLKNGRLFPCSVAPALYKYNQVFGETFVVGKDDYIDIYKDISAEEVFEWMLTPIPCCRYCDKTKEPVNFKWGPTKRDKHEWIIN